MLVLPVRALREVHCPHPAPADLPDHAVGAHEAVDPSRIRDCLADDQRRRGNEVGCAAVRGQEPLDLGPERGIVGATLPEQRVPLFHGQGKRRVKQFLAAAKALNAHGVAAVPPDPSTAS